MSLLRRKMRPFWPTEELRNASSRFDKAFPRHGMTIEQANAFDGFMLLLRRELEVWRKAKRSPNYSASSLKRYWENKRATAEATGDLERAKEGQ